MSTVGHNTFSSVSCDHLMDFYRHPKNVRDMMIIANGNIFVVKKILPPPSNLYPQKSPPRKASDSSELSGIEIDIPLPSYSS